MISVKTWYKTHNGEILAIMKISKTWQYHSKDCHYESFILTDDKNFYYFINLKGLSLKQVWWAQKLLRFYYQIDYYQGKANRATDAISQYLQ